MEQIVIFRGNFGVVSNLSLRLISSCINPGSSQTSLNSFHMVVSFSSMCSFYQITQSACTGQGSNSRRSCPKSDACGTVVSVHPFSTRMTLPRSFQLYHSLKQVTTVHLQNHALFSAARCFVMFLGRTGR